MCIQGPSGAGKTTLLNLIGALDKPTSGTIVVFSHDLETYDEDFLATFRSAYIGYVFQSYNLISTLTAIENIAFVMELAGCTNDKLCIINIIKRITELFFCLKQVTTC